MALPPLCDQFLLFSGNGNSIRLLFKLASGFSSVCLEITAVLTPETLTFFCFSPKKPRPQPGTSNAIPQQMSTLKLLTFLGNLKYFLKVQGNALRISVARRLRLLGVSASSIRSLNIDRALSKLPLSSSSPPFNSSAINFHGPFSSINAFK